jgi:hypothetical protein
LQPDPQPEPNYRGSVGSTGDREIEVLHKVGLRHGSLASVTQKQRQDGRRGVSSPKPWLQVIHADSVYRFNAPASLKSTRRPGDPLHSIRLRIGSFSGMV